MLVLQYLENKKEIKNDLNKFVIPIKLKMEQTEFRLARRRFTSKVYKIIRHALDNEFIIKDNEPILNLETNSSSPVKKSIEAQKGRNNELLGDESELSELSELMPIKCISDIKLFASKLDKYAFAKTKQLARKYGEIRKLSTGKISNYFCKLYEGICRPILNNIDQNNYIKNNSLINKIINGSISAKEIVNLSGERPPALFPQSSQKYYDFINQQDKVSFNRKIISSAVKCHKCRAYSCILSQAQTSCADEAMTTFITCQNCGYTGRL